MREGKIRRGEEEGREGEREREVSYTRTIIHILCSTTVL